jgi:spermidine/putrescine transport system ATP-binding protein
MRNIELKNITKSFDGETILENINLTIPSGKFFAILGPSGSGKTTLLRLIAGFEKPDTGSIFLGTQDITNVPINKRRINTVFQNYALFPHMNVFDNVGYSLRIRGIAPQIIEEKVIKVLQAVRLEKQIYKSVTQLSGGQQQRVALARAIINEPDVLLLDEPLAALDLKLREQMLIELIDLQANLQTTFVYITHDQFEALTVADYMAIMNRDGEIEQVGTPKEIYEFPKTTFVAKFVGTTNIFEGVLREDAGSFKIELKDLGSFAVAVSKDAPWIQDGRALSMSLRPEKIFISKKEMQNFDNVIEGTIVAIVYHGRSTQYNVKLRNGFVVHVFEQNEEHFPHQQIDYDDMVYLYWQKENVVMLER